MKVNMKETDYYKSGQLKHNALKGFEKARSIKINCPHCHAVIVKAGSKRHINGCYLNPLNIKTCLNCSQPIKNWRVGKTCSRACSNTVFRSGENNGNYKEEGYRKICFKKHQKKCAVCDEENIVAVHHLNENHEDDRLENLIPLCPTHHQYMHSRFKKLIQPKINQWLKTNLGP